MSNPYINDEILGSERHAEVLLNWLYTNAQINLEYYENLHFENWLVWLNSFIIKDSL